MRLINIKDPNDILNLDEKTGQVITPAQQPDQTTDTTEVLKPPTVTGHSLEEHMQALESARSAGDTAAMKTIQSDYDKEFEYQKTYGEASPAYQKAVDTASKKKDITATAKSLLTLLSQKDTMDQSTYEDAKSSIASDLYLKMKEGAKLGTQLTPGEQAILAGMAPRLEGAQAGARKWLTELTTGHVAPTTGKVIDSEEALINKMNYIIGGFTGKQVPESLPDFNKTEKKSTETTKEKINWNLPENVLNEVIGMGKSLPAVAGAALEMTPPGMLFNVLRGQSQRNVEIPKAIVGGLIKNLGEHTGIDVNLGQNGDPATIRFDPVQGLIHSYNNPISTAGWIAPGIEALKGIKGAEAVKPIAEAGEAAKVLETTKAAEIASKAPLGVKGRVFTSVAVPIADNITKSEQLMKDAFTISRTAKDPYGMAKELEAFTPKAGAFVDNYVSKLSKPIGPQPGGEIIDDIISRVAQSPEAQTLEGWEPKLRSILENKLKSGETLPGGAEKGEMWATNLEKMNNARKSINQELTGWHSNGRPVVSDTNKLQSLENLAGNELKDMISEADKNNVLKPVINMEHTAMTVAPVLAKKATAGGGAWSIRNAIYRQAIKLMQAPKIAIARKAAGSANPLVEQILSGEMPATAAPEAGASAQLIAPLAGPKYAPSNPPVYEGIPQPLRTIFRDMRTKQGNWKAK